MTELLKESSMSARQLKRAYVRWLRVAWRRQRWVSHPLMKKDFQAATEMAQRLAEELKRRGVWMP